MSLIDRVEVIRGPGSSLYGTSAFFAVINVLTKGGASHAGPRVDTAVGSMATGHITASYGHVFTGGQEMLLAASGYGSAGNTRLYYPEYDSPDTGNGIAVDADGDRAASAFASVSMGRLNVSGGFLDRGKHIPTGAWDSVFGDSRAQTDDKRAYADATYTGLAFSGWTSVARAGLNFYEYVGRVSNRLRRGRHGRSARWIALAPGVRRAHTQPAMAAASVHHRWRGSQNTTGQSVESGHRASMDCAAESLDAARRVRTGRVDGPTLDARERRRSRGPRQHLRRQRHAAGRPRLATAPAVGGEAPLRTRIPRAELYELFYFDTMREQQLTLSPETIDTTKLVWEEYIGAHVRTTASVFRYDARHLIAQQSLDDTSGDSLYFTNADQTTARGVDAEIEGRWNAVTVRVSYENVKATDWTSGERLSNSPQHLGKVGVVFPLNPLATSLALDGRFTGERQTLYEGTIPGFALANITTTTTLSRVLDLQFGLYNALNQQYADPGAEEHLQPPYAGWTHDSRAVDGQVLKRSLRRRRPMRPQERADLAHRQRNALLRLLPRIHADFGLRRQHRRIPSPPRTDAPACRRAGSAPASGSSARSRASR